MIENRKQGNSDVNAMRKNLTLDLQPNNFNSEKNSEETIALSSPDLHKLYLKTPELENLILQARLSDAVLTPATGQSLFPEGVAEEECYDAEFENALSEMHWCDSSQRENHSINISSNSCSSNGSVFNDSATHSHLGPHQVTDYYPVAPTYDIGMSLQGAICMDEPQAVSAAPHSPTSSLTDVEHQDIVKLERKRMRNRVAALNCRRRKLERIARLEDRIKWLRGENNDLSALAVGLREQVSRLKEEVMTHVNNGCLILNYY